MCSRDWRIAMGDGLGIGRELDVHAHGEEFGRADEGDGVDGCLVVACGDGVLESGVGPIVCRDYR